MDNTQKCPKCGEEMKLIPAGISKKTGKSYKAFFSCKACGYTMNVPDDIAGKVEQQYPKTSYKSKEEFEEKRNERIQHLHNDTTENINWNLSWKLASEMVYNHPLYASETEKQIEESVEILQKWYYPRLAQRTMPQKSTKSSTTKPSFKEEFPEEEEDFDELLTQEED